MSIEINKKLNTSVSITLLITIFYSLFLASIPHSDTSFSTNEEANQIYGVKPLLNKVHQTLIPERMCEILMQKTSESAPIKAYKTTKAYILPVSSRFESFQIALNEFLGLLNLKITTASFLPVYLKICSFLC